MCVSMWLSESIFTKNKDGTSKNKANANLEVKPRVQCFQKLCKLLRLAFKIGLEPSTPLNL